jgi:hypothetical protein
MRIPVESGVARGATSELRKGTTGYFMRSPRDLSAPRYVPTASGDLDLAAQGDFLMATDTGAGVWVSKATLVR